MGHDSRLNPFSRDAINPPPAVVCDVYGRVLSEQDLIQLHPLVPPLYRITAIRPCVDPTAPPNLMDIELSVTTLFRCARGVPNKEFIRVITAAEAIQKGARPLDVPAPPPPGKAAGPAGRMELVQPLGPIEEPGGGGEPPAGEPS